MNWIETILAWSEVWALLIPLAIIITRKPKGKHIRFIIMYVVIGLVLNLIAVIMLEYYYLFPTWMYVDGYLNNNLLYNIHSVVRVLLLGWYLTTVRPYKYPLLLKGLFIGFILFVTVNFSFFENPLYLSTRLFSVESIVLLSICLLYYFRSIQDEGATNWLRHSSFLVATGISLYEAITFFIFLFFYPLADQDSAYANTDFAIATMRLYTVMFIILCIMLALALHKSRKENATSS
jgi:hypothetical protein